MTNANKKICCPECGRQDFIIREYGQTSKAVLSIAEDVMEISRACDADEIEIECAACWCEIDESENAELFNAVFEIYQDKNQ